MKDRLFIFDVDGTLVNSRAGIISALSDTFKTCFQKDISENELYQFSGFHFDFLVNEFIGKCNEEEYNNASKYYSDVYKTKYSNQVGLFKDVQTCLEELSTKVLLSTATNMSQAGAENLLTMLNISKYFDKIVGTTNYAKAKPNPDILNESIDELGILPENTIMFGDSPNDIIAGKNAGVKTVALVYGQHTPQLLLSYKPEYVYHSFKDIMQLV